MNHFVWSAQITTNLTPSRARVLYELHSQVLLEYFGVISQVLLE